MSDYQVSCDYCPMPAQLGSTVCAKCELEQEIPNLTAPARRSTRPNDPLLASFRQVCQDARDNGTTTISVHYNGSSDNGSLDDIEIDEGELDEASQQVISDTLYLMLNNMYSGWEVDNGSQGDIHIRLGTDEVEFEHEWNEMTTNPDHKTRAFDALGGIVNRA